MESSDILIASKVSNFLAPVSLHDEAHEKWCRPGKREWAFQRDGGLEIDVQLRHQVARD